MKNRINLKRVLVLFSVTFIFLFSLMSIATAERIETLQFIEQQEYGSYIHGRGWQFNFNDDGTTLYVSSQGSGQRAICQFSVADPFNVSSTLFVFNTTCVNQLNVTSPAQNPISFDTANDSELYVGYSQAFSYQGFIRHFKIVGNLTSINATNQTVVENYSIPNGERAVAIDISEDGTRMLAVTENLGLYYVHSYSLSTPYNLTTMSPNADYIPLGSVYNVYDIATTNSGTKFYLMLGQNNGVTALIEEYNMSLPYNVSTAFQVGSVSIVQSPTYWMGSIYATNDYFFTNIADNTLTINYLSQYDFNTTGGGGSNTTAGGQAAAGFVANFAAIFPEASTLTFEERMAYVLALMLITAIAFIIGGLVLGMKDNLGILLWILIIFLALEFFYFTAISYIPVGVLITLCVIALGIVLVRIRS